MTAALSGLILALLVSIKHVDALKLTSLGSTFKSTDDVNVDIAATSHDDLVDYSTMACYASDGSSNNEPLATCTSNYGVDYSFPIQHSDTININNNPFNDAQKIYYDNFLQGCRDYYHPEGYKCVGSERDRIEMNLRQPRSMFNYTTLGFHKVRAPNHLMALIHKFWKQKFTSIDNIPNETWIPEGNTYTNHWESPTKMLNLDSTTRKLIWEASKESLEQWTGVELSPTSLYGVRVYTEDAILAPHVDRMPLVISAIINVAQDVDEHWPLEVYGHDGKAYNITMEPGDMIFYESHSVIHGRPFPLKGRYYANVFVHFEPLGHTLQYEEEGSSDNEESLQSLYQEAWNKLQSKCSDDEDCKQRVDLNLNNKVPHYIIPGSEEERRWLQTHPKARVDTSKDEGWVKGLNVHTAASSGDMDALIAIAGKNIALLKKKDNNGWNSLHEAGKSAGGHLEVVKFLIEKGLDKDERTHTGDGGSPLWWAKKTHGVKHPVVQYLESLGAKEVPPKGHDKIKDKD